MRKKEDCNTMSLKEHLVEKKLFYAWELWFRGMIKIYLVGHTHFKNVYRCFSGSKKLFQKLYIIILNELI